jgi:hypothetical protein
MAAVVLAAIQTVIILTKKAALRYALLYESYHRPNCFDISKAIDGYMTNVLFYLS